MLRWLNSSSSMALHGLWRVLRPLTFIAVTISACTLMAMPTAAQEVVDYYDGLRLWDQRLTEEALAVWVKAANLGDTQAMQALAEGHLRTDLSYFDPAMAYFWLAVATRQGRDDLTAIQKDLAATLPAEAIAMIDAAAGKWSPEATTREMAIEELDAVTSASLEAEILDLIEKSASYDEFVELVDAIPTTWLDESSPIVGRALSSSDPRYIEALIERGWDPNLPVNIISAVFSQVHLAAMDGDLAKAVTLVRHGAIAAIQDTSGRFPHDIVEPKPEGGDTALVVFLREQAARDLVEPAKFLIDHGYIDAAQVLDSARMKQAIELFKGDEAARLDVATYRELQSLASAAQPINYQYVLRMKIGGESKYLFEAATARSALELRQQAIERCGAMQGENCRFNFAPQGTCISAVADGDSVFVSKPQMTAAKAEEDVRESACVSRQCLLLKTACAARP